MDLSLSKPNENVTSYKVKRVRCVKRLRDLSESKKVWDFRALTGNPNDVYLVRVSRGSKTLRKWSYLK